MTKYRRKQPKYRPKQSKYKIKDKEGYELKEGSSGQLRWHRKIDMALIEEMNKPKSVNPSVKVMGTSDADLARRLKSGRYQASPGLQDMIKYAGYANDSQREKADEVANMYLTRNATPQLRRAVADPSWSLDNAGATGGIASSLGVGIKSAILEYHHKLMDVQSRSGSFDRMASVFDNADMGITPDLPTVNDMMKQHKDADTPVFRMYQDDLSGSSTHLTVGRVSEEDRNRLIGARILDLLVLEKAKASSLSDNSVYPLYDDLGMDMPTLVSIDPSALARLGSHSASMRNITGRVVKGGEVAALGMLLDKMKSHGYDYNKLGLGKFSTSGGSVFADSSDYMGTAENIGKIVRDIALKDNDYMMQTIIENMTVTALDDRESKSIEEASMARFFSNIVADKFISSLQLKGNQAAIDKLREGLMADLNANNKAKITSNPKDFVNIIGTGEILADSSSLNPSYYTANRGTAVTSTDTRAVPDRVGERVMPGYSMVSLHEAVHGLDNFMGGLMSAMSQQISYSYTGQRETNLGGRSAFRDATDDQFFVKNGIHVDPQMIPKLEERINARRGITGSAAKFAREMITRNQNELDVYNKYSQHPQGNEIIKQNAMPVIVDKYPSAGFFIPEMNRLAYILAANRNMMNPDMRPALHNNFLDFKHNSMYDTDANPESATVGLEYALGAPHILEASDEIFGTTYRKDVNTYYGMSVVQKSDPILLANARATMLAAKENPDSLYRGYIDKTVNDVRKYGMTPYQGKVPTPLERGLPIGIKV